MTLLLVLLLAALWPSSAKAALWIEFEPPGGPPGTMVEGHTMGEGAMAAGPGRAFPAYIVPNATNDRTPIGHVVVDGRGNGTLKFEVPDLPGGEYSIRMMCKPCAEYSAGQTELFVGEFRVVASPGPPSSPAPEGSWVPGAFLAAGILALGVVYVRRRRVVQHQQT